MAISNNRINADTRLGNILLLFVMVVILGVSIGFGYDGTTEGRYNFTGPITGFDVIYSIYLPPDYASSSDVYPVIYWYTPWGGTPDPDDAVISAYESCRSEGKIGDAIIVFTNLDNDSWYADSKDGSRPIATSTVKELVPYIDENYRTKANRGNRVAMGFSMGSNGAISHWSKYYETYSICVEFDGPTNNFEELGAEHPDHRSAMYDDDEEYFLTQSFWGTLPQNYEYLAANSVVLQIMGNHGPENERLRDLFEGYGITHEYYETGCEHDLGCILGNMGVYAFEFVQTHLADPVMITRPFTINHASKNETAQSVVSVYDFQGRLIQSIGNKGRFMFSKQSARGTYLMRLGADTQHGAKVKPIVK